jgi:hypothetical protein
MKLLVLLHCSLFLSSVNNALGFPLSSRCTIKVNSSGGSTPKTNTAEQSRPWLKFRSGIGRITSSTSASTRLRLANNGDKKRKKNSPYGDFDYSNYTPEFIDYSNPDYVVDQGLVDGEEIAAGSSSETDEDLLEKMREERRKRNDEYQFETYFAKMWKNGAEFRGEWTVYGTTTFFNVNHESKNRANSEDEYPELIKAKRVARVISSASKEMVNPDAEWRGDREVIRHAEYEVTNEASESTLISIRDVDTDSGFGRHSSDMLPSVVGSNGGSKESARTPLLIRYWPEGMTSFDFRGQQGNMCVGVAYTVCDAVKLHCTGSPGGDDGNADQGPFSELRSEIGIIEDSLRMRVKFEYGILNADSITSTATTTSGDDPTATPPPLRLKTITVCRERLEEWPCNRRDAPLFRSVGANGGLYDPPPVGCERQASRYMSIDVEGGASILFPHLIDQCNKAFNNGWVLSLDWTPGNIRYQVDRKFQPGQRIKGLRTLELSEVQALEADRYRPTDSQNMRQ